MSWTIHIAGPVTGAVQRCAVCQHPLEDNTAWFEGRVGVMVEDAERGPAWWPEGQMIGVNGNCTVTLADRPLAPDERLCAGVN